MNSKFRPVLLGCLVSALLSFPAAVSNAEKAGPVATVNGVEISRDDYDRAMKTYQQTLSGKSKTPPDPAEIEDQVLQTLITIELLHQEAQKKGIMVSEDEIDKQWEAFKGRFPDQETLKSWLEQNQFTETSVREQIKRGAAIKKYNDQQFLDTAEVSEEDVKKYYEGNLQLFKKPEQVHASHILIKADPSGSEAEKLEAKRKLEEIQADLKEGGDFGDLAKEYSEGPSAPRGGDLGTFGRGRMVKPFEDAAFALEPGEVSDIVETQFGYHLIKVTEKTPETTLGYEEVKDRIQDYLKRDLARQEMQRYVQNLKSQAEIEIFLDSTSKSDSD